MIPHYMCIDEINDLIVAVDTLGRGGKARLKDLIQGLQSKSTPQAS